MNKFFRYRTCLSPQLNDFIGQYHNINLILLLDVSCMQTEIETQRKGNGDRFLIPCASVLEEYILCVCMFVCLRTVMQCHYGWASICIHPCLHPIILLKMYIMSLCLSMQR